jgi:hypothetical protein
MNFFERNKTGAQGASAMRIVDYINELRNLHGATVMVMWSNSAAPPHQRERVDVCSDWTHWVTKPFFGETVEAALANAVRTKRSAT